MDRGRLIRLMLKGVADKALTSEKAYKKKKLNKMLKHAKENSRFYQDLYRDIDIDKITPDNITELPTVTKSMLLERYDDWICDSNVHKDEVVKFASDLNNLDKFFLDRYVVDSTSGTTGEKLKVLNSKDDFEYMMAMGAVYTWPKKSYAFDILKSGRPIVYVIPTDGFYASVMIAGTYLGLSKSSKSEIIDFRVPIDEIVEKINSINPILIGGYASSLLILADEADAGRLNIDVKYIVPIGTAYSKDARERIREAFNCETFTSYSCTEGGEVGCECVNGHYHIAYDVIVEAADENMVPVEDGIESDCLLITNLWNKAAPFIRYQLNDRCIIHSEPCGCGCKRKWIEVIGREVMRIPFKSKEGNRIIQLTDFTFELMLNDICSGLADHQLVIDNGRIEIRLRMADEAKKLDKFNKIKDRIDHIAELNCIEIITVLSDIEPVIEPSGKFRRIIVNQKVEDRL